MDLLKLTRKLIPIVIEAGEIELKYFNKDTEVFEKSDGSPVTIADREAEDLIKKHLTELYPDIHIIGEESVASGDDIPDISSGTFWLVDPLDGTLSYIKGEGSFSVNIALMQNFQPVAGIIHVPVSNETYFGADSQAFKILSSGEEIKIKTRIPPEIGITVVGSRHYKKSDLFTRFLEKYKIAEIYSKSSSIKFCEIAEGKADMYPRFAPTCEWDTAAGQAILDAAGGCIKKIDGEGIVYGNKDNNKFLNPSFIAYGDEKLKYNGE